MHVALHGQRIILRHLGKFFGRRLTVPEQKICELELGALPLISGHVTVRGEPVTFWYKNVDEAIQHRLKLEFDSRGLPFFGA